MLWKTTKLPSGYVCHVRHAHHVHHVPSRSSSESQITQINGFHRFFISPIPPIPPISLIPPTSARLRDLGLTPRAGIYRASPLPAQPALLSRPLTGLSPFPSMAGYNCHVRYASRSLHPSPHHAQKQRHTRYNKQ